MENKFLLIYINRTKAFLDRLNIKDTLTNIERNAYKIENIKKAYGINLYDKVFMKKVINLKE